MTTPDPRRALSVLAFLSGMCGLAYEVLYTRLLTTYLGDLVTVSAAILASFLTGIGVGSLVAHRFYRRLWLIEALIGAYGAGVAVVTSQVSAGTIGGLLPAGAGVTGAVLAVVMVVAIPSALIGCSVPLFSRYLTVVREEGTADGFARTYALYNFGAGLCVLVIELWLLRTFGMSGGMLAVAVVNVLTAVGLHRLGAPAGGDAVPSPTLAGGPWLALFVVSALSAVYQLVILRFVGTVFGPFHENFALVLWLVMLGLGTGSLWASRRKSELPPWLVAGGLVIVANAVFLGDLARGWAFLSGTVAPAGLARTGLKGLVILAMALPSFTVFGGTVPAFLRSTDDDPGRALAVSSFGNCAGFLLAVFVLLARLSYLGLIAFVALGTVAVGIASMASRRRAIVATASAGLLGALLVARWPSRQFKLGHLSFVSSEALAEAQDAYVASESVKRLDGDVNIVTLKSGAEYVTINGYSSFAVAEGGGINHREVIVGIAPTLYPPQTKRALVLGTGTGITAGATATVFDHTTVVEVNPAVYEALPRFSRHNFGLDERDDVTLRLDDGLSVLAREPTTYDVVISTVTSPVYFSSSKLYTLDFFELVKSRLNPGGVFAFWFDARISDAGTGIILETMQRSFADCHFVFLFSTYFEAVCGNEPLAPKPRGRWPEELDQAMARWTQGVGLDGLLDALLLKPTRFADHDWGAPANTFDLPALEHVMARETLARQSWSFDAWVRFDVQRSLLFGEPWLGPRFAERCHLFARVGSRTMLPACDVLTYAAGGTWDRHFVDLAHDYLGASGRSVVPFEDLVRALLLTGQKERALAVLERRKKGRTPTLEVVRLELKLALEGSVSDEELATLYARDPFGAGVRSFLVTASIHRKRYRQALAHLLFLDRVHGLDARQQALLGKLRAIVEGP